ncbi:FtsX-like permease family protein [uncultured Paraglaciecola sp.]|uniref:ABC transporter permease n=1 Tax=uncultured Paraglaciecola sp. TaxID=1765024 RepID=UPI0025E3221C|nr:FtsX-like permease family protein [uncultured Paraglaciecola sp.]
MLLSVAWNSLLSRKKTVVLTLLSLCVSTMVLISVEHIRLQAKESFNRTISSVDLIVGAPSGQLNMLLYSIFRMGNPTNNIKYESFLMLQQHEVVEWAIPLSLGDSHRGFRVMGTNGSYFTHYKYGNNQNLRFKEGREFDGLFDAVIGADVAKTLGYQVNDKIVIAHGIGSTSFTHHEQAPFVVSGILLPTGSPVDKTVHISLEAIEAVHLPPSTIQTVLNNPKNAALRPESITSVMLGLTNKFAIFRMQRELNNYSNDRLMAILPGVAMAELWSLMSTVENLLRAIAALVLISSLFGLATMLLASMNERQGEIAVLRVLGAGPFTLLLLILFESLILICISIAMAISGLKVMLVILDGWMVSEFGLFLSHNLLSSEIVSLIGLVILATMIVSLYPGIEAYKKALHMQLTGK